MSKLPAGLVLHDDTSTTTSDDEQEYYSMPRQCPWCLREQGLPMGEGSHGICQQHSNAMYASAVAGRESRRNRRNR